MFKVAIIGGELMGDYDKFTQKCILCLKNKAKEGCGIMIYTIGDKFVDEFAKKYHISTQFFITDWKKHGKNALKERNEQMLSTADAVICFNTGNKDINMLLKMATDKQLPLRNIK